MNLKEADKSLYERLCKLFGEAFVSCSSVDRLSYGRDLWPKGLIWTRRGKAPFLPDFVVWPRHLEQLRELLLLANEMLIPIVPFGAGSGVCGAAIPVRGGVVVDMKRMSRILQVDETSLTVRVETGILGQHLEDELNKRGYTTGHFPASIHCSTLGGYLSTRSSGQLSTRYGNIEDMVVGMKVVVPKGQVIEFKAVPRSAAGPDLKHLFLGAEGTLGIIAEATMKLWPLPQSRLFFSFLFPDLREGLEAVREMKREGASPAVARLYDDEETAIMAGEYGLPLSRKGCLLILTFEGREELAKAEAGIACPLAKEHGGQDLGPQPSLNWWKNRYAFFYKMSQVMAEPAAFADTIEVASSWSSLLALYQEMKKAMAPYAQVVAHFSHFYAQGCSLYFTFLTKAHPDEQEKLYERIWQVAMEACIRAGGTISHHHGLGLLKAPWIKKEHGQAWLIYEAMKKMLDPRGIMNPGKMEVDS